MFFFYFSVRLFVWLLYDQLDIANYFNLEQNTALINSLWMFSTLYLFLFSTLIWQNAYAFTVDL